jgi:hypothetical protein
VYCTSVVEASLAVERIAQDRMAKCSHVQSQLMRSEQSNSEYELRAKDNACSRINKRTFQ